MIWGGLKCWFIIKKQLSYENKFGNKEVKLGVPPFIFLYLYCSRSVSETCKKKRRILLYFTGVYCIHNITQMCRNSWLFWALIATCVLNIVPEKPLKLKIVIPTDLFLFLKCSLSITETCSARQRQRLRGRKRLLAHAKQCVRNSDISTRSCDLQSEVGQLSLRELNAAGDGKLHHVASGAPCGRHAGALRVLSGATVEWHERKCEELASGVFGNTAAIRDFRSSRWEVRTRRYSFDRKHEQARGHALCRYSSVSALPGQTVLIPHICATLQFTHSWRLQVKNVDWGQ